MLSRETNRSNTRHWLIKQRIYYLMKDLPLRGLSSEEELSRRGRGSVEALATAMEEEGIGATSETLCLVFVDGSADLDDGVGGQM
jgi:hypothetical protein